MEKLCILLTSSIDTKGIIFMKRNDSKIREKDYLGALEKWIDLGVAPLVFCENSGYDLTRFRDLFRKSKRIRTEIIQFDGQSFPRGLGKGYGDFQSIIYATKRSEIIKDSEIVIKVSGRYFVENIREIIGSLRKLSFFVVASLSSDLAWADMRVVAFDPGFSEYLSVFQNVIDDSSGFYSEHALARAITRAVSEGHRWVSFPQRPVIDGYSGTFDVPMKEVESFSHEG